MLRFFGPWMRPEKNSAIKHVMSGLNTQCCEVYSFEQPNPLELGYDFL